MELSYRKSRKSPINVISEMLTLSNIVHLYHVLLKPWIPQLYNGVTVQLLYILTIRCLLLVCVKLCPGRTGSELCMNRLSLRSNRWKLETSRELPIILEEFMEEYTSNE